MSKSRSVSESLAPSRNISAACWQCDQIGPHRVVAEMALTDLIDGVDLRYQRWDSLVSCIGCRDTFFVREERWTDVRESACEPGGSTVAVYPSREMGHMPIPGVNLLPPGIREIYEATRSALCARQLSICELGFRAIVEQTCVEVGADGPDIQRKLDKLVALQLTTRHIADTINRLSAMDQTNPFQRSWADIQKLQVVWRMIEQILESAFLAKRNK